MSKANSNKPAAGSILILKQFPEGFKLTCLSVGEGVVETPVNFLHVISLKYIGPMPTVLNTGVNVHIFRVHKTAREGGYPVAGTWFVLDEDRFEELLTLRK